MRNWLRIKSKPEPVDLDTLTEPQLIDRFKEKTSAYNRLGHSKRDLKAGKVLIEEMSALVDARDKLRGSENG